MFLPLQTGHGNWQDWATPVHRRPRWAHRLARPGGNSSTRTHHCSWTHLTGGLEPDWSWLHTFALSLGRCVASRFVPSVPARKLWSSWLVLSSTQPTRSCLGEVGDDARVIKRSSFSPLISSQDVGCSHSVRASCCNYSSVLVAVEARSTPDHCARALCFAICAAQRGSWKPFQLAQFAYCAKLDLSRVFGTQSFAADSEEAAYVRKASNRKLYCIATRSYADFWLSSRRRRSVPHLRRRLRHMASTLGVCSAVRCPPSSCCPPVWTRSLIAAKRSPRLFKVLPGRPANMGECGNECLSRRDVTC